MTFVFETGEVWSIESEWLYKNVIPYVEPAFAEALKGYGSFLRRLGVQGPLKWIGGLRGMKGLRYDYPSAHGQSRVGIGPICTANEIVADGAYDGVQSPHDALLPFFRKIFAKCGQPRPEYLPK